MAFYRKYQIICGQLQLAYLFPCFAYLAYLGMQPKKDCLVKVICLLAYLAYLFIIFRYI